jgi:glucose/arabinose dehydrogenase
MNRRALVIAVLAVVVLSRPASADDVHQSSIGPLRLETVAQGLDRPWSLAFLPGGEMLVSERPGYLRVVSPGGEVSDPLAGLPAIAAEGQGGLLDIALHPEFTTNRLVFLSFAEQRDGGFGTSVMRGRLADDLTALEDVTVIFRQQPAVDSGEHFGARLVFDRSGAIFLTTGDRGFRDAVQDPATNIGKIIRMTIDGGVPDGNPKPEGWHPENWSIGHRNVQGAALHPETGALWTVEHGAKGGDELNRPDAGRNYGWPVISYGREYSGARIGAGEEMTGMEQPVHYWDPSIAPSGMVFYTGDRYPGWNGNLFVGALAQKHLARVILENDKVVGEERLFDGLARIRDVRQGPDGFLYLLTDQKAPNGRILRVVRG